MKLIRRCAAGILILMVWSMTAFAVSARDDASLLSSRIAHLWVGGTVLGDVVAGADAKLEFIVIDKKLASRIYEAASHFPDEVVWNASYIAKASKMKCRAVIVNYECFTRCDFYPGNIRVNGQAVPPSRILSPLKHKMVGRLSSGMRDSVVIAVPQGKCRPGSTLSFEYAGSAVRFTVPR